MPYARRRYRCASCSQVMPIPPSTWMQSLAFALAASIPTAAATRRGDGELVVVGVGRRAGGVGRGHRRLLGAQQHLGTHVLDRLEAADRLTELLAHLRVLGRGLAAPAGQPRRLGRQHRGGQIDDALRGHRQCLGGGRRSSTTRASGREKSVAVKRLDGDTFGGGVDEQPTARPAGSSSTPPAVSPPSTNCGACPIAAVRVEGCRPRSATPAVRSPDASASSSGVERSSTRVASAVVATGPGTNAAAASSTIAQRSSTVPPAPPSSSGIATPKIPSCARPPYGARHASGSPCSTSRGRPTAPDPRPSYGPVHARQTARR